MSQFTIIGTPLYQWESGRKMRITPLRGMTVDAVHFSNYGDSTALVVKPKEENGHYIADIPNILLQDDQNIVVYSVNVAEDKVETIRECVFPVRKRAKPSSYVYTETEVLNYSSLDKRIHNLEGEGLSKAVADYLKENPVEAVATFVVAAVKDTEHNETRIDRTNAEIFAARENGETVVCQLDFDGMRFILQPMVISADIAAFACLMQNESIGLMLVNDVLEVTNMEFTTTEDLDGAVNTALEQAKESGLFDGKPGADGQDGKDGQDGSPGRDGVDGQPGKDGVSVTHSWNGTVLSVTSASGTSSADLKGERGEPGKDGKDGNPGEPGTTPVRGVDYWTDADKAEIKSYVDTAILGGAW